MPGVLLSASVVPSAGSWRSRQSPGRLGLPSLASGTDSRASSIAVGLVTRLVVAAAVAAVLEGQLQECLLALTGFDLPDKQPVQPLLSVPGPACFP